MSSVGDASFSHGRSNYLFGLAFLGPKLSVLFGRNCTVAIRVSAIRLGDHRTPFVGCQATIFILVVLVDLPLGPVQVS